MNVREYNPESLRRLLKSFEDRGPPTLTRDDARDLGLKPLLMPHQSRRWKREHRHYLTLIDDQTWFYGSAVTWASSGGTNVITCTSLAAAAARQGAKGAIWQVAPGNGITQVVTPDLLKIFFKCQHTSAPAAGGEDALYWGFSDSATAGTDNPGGLSGTDSAVSNIDVLPQLTFAGSIVVSNSIGTGVQSAYLYCPVLDLYASPVVFNNASTAFDATALHTNISAVPLFRVRAA